LKRSGEPFQRTCDSRDGRGRKREGTNQALYIWKIAKKRRTSSFGRGHSETAMTGLDKVKKLRNSEGEIACVGSLNKIVHKTGTRARRGNAFIPTSFQTKKAQVKENC